ncbi:UNVERIFIED_CONTAM: protein LONGIFOLIA 1 [Sesamum latifolium]|uniref:Protein LONGIFOLIA 1 n=1 Tax=Sesamum latifolium TaxID=2727402 RepID=A0AAW2UF97_9LAMI
MAAELLHSLTDENPDLQKQIGCMTGIFQLFDRQHMLTGGRRILGDSPKRLLLPGNSHFSGGTLERETGNAHLQSASTEKHLNKNIQEKQRFSTESSRASFSSSSRSSSFSSLDCNRATQLEPASFDRIVFPETPSRDPTMSLQNSSPQFSRQSLDLRDFVKDSMYREVPGLSSKAKTTDEAADPFRDTPRTKSKISNGSHGSRIDKRQSAPADLKESDRIIMKVQEPPWYHDEPRELLRSLSYHANDGSSFSISKDAPRFSYDGWEVNRAPFDSRDISKSTPKLKDLPRLSLDSREGSIRSLTSDSKSNFFLKSMQKNNGDFDGKAQSLQQTPANQARPPSVVAKLMGLETLPDAVSSSEANSGSSRNCRDEGLINISRSLGKKELSQSQLSNSSKNLWKEPGSPRWRNSDSSMKPMSRFPIEPAPWKQIDGTRSSQKPASRTSRAPAKVPTAFPSVYSEIEKRLKDLEFTQSGKDLRALKQILEAMQSKGFLETQKEGQGSSFTGRKDHDQKLSSSKHEERSGNNRMPQTDQIIASTKRTTGSSRHHESPIVIMKPAKLVEKSGIPVASVISLDGLSSLPKLHDNEFADNIKGFSSRTTKDPNSRSSQRDNAVNSVNLKNGTTPKSTQVSARSQQDGTAGLGKSSGSISPRMQQKKLEMERRSRPPTPPDSSKSRRQSNKQQAESSSPGGRRRPKHPSFQKSDDQLSEVNVESRNLNYHENENSVQSNESVIRSSVNTVVVSSERSPGINSCQSPPMKASDMYGLVEKKSTLTLRDEGSAEFGFIPPEYSSPVSVLANVVCKDDSPSPIKYVGKALKVDISMDDETDSNALEGSPANSFIPISMESSSTSEINRKKLQNIENLVQKLKRLNSSHDEACTDYIASLCENTDPDHRYISEILLASGLLLRELGSSIENFQFHPSGHPINPELFLVLEQTKPSTTQEEQCSTEKASQSMIKEKLHRKLIFDGVNEILARKLASGPFSEPRLRPFKLATQTLNAQKLLRELCCEIEELQAKNPECSSDKVDDRLKSILCKDVMHWSERWTGFDDEISGAVLDIERLIFKDLVNEIVIGESAGLKTKPGRRRVSAK